MWPLLMGGATPEATPLIGTTLTSGTICGKMTDVYERKVTLTDECDYLAH